MQGMVHQLQPVPVALLTAWLQEALALGLLQGLLFALDLLQGLLRVAGLGVMLALGGPLPRCLLLPYLLLGLLLPCAPLQVVPRSLGVAVEGWMLPSVGPWLCSCLQLPGLPLLVAVMGLLWQGLLLGRARLLG